MVSNKLVSHKSVSYQFQTLFGLVAVCGLTLAGDAMARNSYCCNDANKRLVCGDMLPAACQGRAYRIKDEKGNLVREVEAPLTPEQKARREAEAIKKQEEEKRVAEQKRRDQAMLATYPDEQAIDAARDRALAEFDKGAADSQKRQAELLKRKKSLERETEFYQKKPLPANLKKQIEEVDADLKKLQESTDGRVKEREAISAKYDEDKKRYRDLKSGKVSR